MDGENLMIYLFLSMELNQHFKLLIFLLELKQRNLNNDKLIKLNLELKNQK
jgi:hypothetical protein